MGLDVYLYSKAEREQNDAFEAASNALYARYESGELTKEEWYATKVEPEYARSDSVPSERYPDHLFNRRYLRSSYNSGGFNHAVPDFLSTAEDGAYPAQEGSLYWIFEPMGREWDGDEGTLRASDVPLLQQCKARALDVAERLRKVDPLRVDEIGNFLVPPTMRQQDFLAWYRKEKAEREGKPSVFDGDGYSCREGTVFGFAKGMEVLAITVGLGTFGEPAALIVYRSEAVDSYIESAEITAEFCDEAIGLIERDGSAHISWSG